MELIAGLAMSHIHTHTEPASQPNDFAFPQDGQLSNHVTGKAQARRQ